MEDPGSSVTLIFYRINDKWWTEPALNVISAAAQMSSLTHCEIAIGEENPLHSRTHTHTHLRLGLARLVFLLVRRRRDKTAPCGTLRGSSTTRKAW